MRRFSSLPLRADFVRQKAVPSDPWGRPSIPFRRTNCAEYPFRYRGFSAQIADDHDRFSPTVIAVGTLRLCGQEFV